LPLHKTLVLLDRIRLENHTPFLEHELLALAKAIVYSISNLHFGPEVGLGPIKADAAVVNTWLWNVQTMAQDLGTLHAAAVVPAVVHHADSRQLAQMLEPESIDAVITSPPYPNEKDYTRTTRLESVILGLVRNKSDLRLLKQ